MVPNKRTERARAVRQGDDLLDPLVAGPLFSDQAARGR